MKRRVVVTGLGAVTPIGNTVEEFWSGIKEGKVGIGEITKFDTTEYKVKIAAEVKDFQAKDRMDFKAARRMEPFSQYAVAASAEAIADALFGETAITGKTPFQIPRTMEQVLNQREDLPKDIQDPLFEYGFGIEVESFGA